jgi:tellurite resistance protein TerC
MTVDDSLWLWIGFNACILAIIAIDLSLLRRSYAEISVKQALVLSSVWAGMALIFNYGIYHYQGKTAALNFLTGYLIEASLSIDNLFLFLALFQYFQTPQSCQHKVLFWGILGAIVMRTAFIVCGIALVHQLHWILYLFGFFLLYAAIKIALSKNKKEDLKNNLLLQLLRKWIPLSANYDGDHFFVFRAGRWLATPLFLVLLSIEATDLAFALDSIPAVMAITLDPFIIYTSNIFAILGLRSLYFVLAGLLPYFHFLNYGLTAILGFVGIKMLLQPFLEIPISVTLAFIVASLTVSISASLLFPQTDTKS